MKGKILSVLFSLMLVFGMLIASCDNGDLPKDPTKDAKGVKTDNNKTTLELETFKIGTDDYKYTYLFSKGIQLLNDDGQPAVDDYGQPVVTKGAYDVLKGLLYGEVDLTSLTPPTPDADYFKVAP